MELAASRPHHKEAVPRRDPTTLSVWGVWAPRGTVTAEPTPFVRERYAQRRHLFTEQG